MLHRMEITTKAMKVNAALRQLRDEARTTDASERMVKFAIEDFMSQASDETKAKLFDLVADFDTPAEALASIAA